MNRKIAALTVGSALAMAVSACQSAPTSGTITELEYEPGFYETVSDTDCRTVRTGKTSTTKCTPNLETTWVPECWEVDFEDKDGNTGEACVTEDEFKGLKVGDHFSV